MNSIIIIIINDKVTNLMIEACPAKLDFFIRGLSVPLVFILKSFEFQK